VGVGVTVVVLTVGVVDDVAVVVGDAAGVVDDVGVVVGVVPAPPEKRGWRNSAHESRYNTVSPSETSNIVGDTA
jgi:hypothetical protein